MKDKKLSTTAFLVPYLFLALSYVHFRKSGKISSFQAVKSEKAGMFIGFLVFALTLGSLIFSGIDIAAPLSEQMDTIKLYYGGLIMFLALGYIVKYLSKKNAHIKE